MSCLNQVMCSSVSAFAWFSALLLVVVSSVPPQQAFWKGHNHHSTFGTCSGLHGSYATCYGVSEIPADDIWPTVVILYIAESNIQNLPNNAFQMFPNLTELHVIDSKVQTVDADAFRGIDSLVNIYLRDNSIRTLRSAYLPENVKFLDISNNPLDFSGESPFPEYAPYLQTLHANDVGATKMSAHIQGLEKLSQLRIMRNSLQSLNLEEFVGLEYLYSIDVEYNDIKNVVALPTGVQLMSVTFLDIGHNQLASIDSAVFESLPALQELCLHDNPLTIPADVAFLSHESLSRLLLSRVDASALSSMTFEAVPKLTSLELIQSGISNISGVFIGLRFLKTLNLGKNVLGAVESDTFAKTGVLNRLLLNGNPLQYFDPRALDEVMTRGAIDISDTPMACLIEYDDLLIWVNQRNVDLYADCAEDEATPSPSPTPQAVCASDGDCTEEEHCCSDKKCSLNHQCGGGAMLHTLPLIVLLFVAMSANWQKPSP